MFQFIESIRINEGSVERIDLHQSRVNKTFLYFGKPVFFQLQELVNADSVKERGVVKCRVKYDLSSIHEITYTDYAVRKIESISFVELSGRKYDFKYAERGWITDMLSTSGTDEIIMTDQGIIKDASYANLAFFDGSSWYTPLNPLLEGTHRSYLIETKMIYPKEIKIGDLHHYSEVKFINAMMTWEESPTLPTAMLT
jgi:4-amino-4-deoxychorismate lyase